MLNHQNSRVQTVFYRHPNKDITLKNITGISKKSTEFCLIETIHIFQKCANASRKTPLNYVAAGHHKKSTEQKKVSSFLKRVKSALKKIYNKSINHSYSTNFFLNPPLQDSFHPLLQTLKDLDYKAIEICLPQLYFFIQTYIVRCMYLFVKP